MRQLPPGPLLIEVIVVLDLDTAVYRSSAAAPPRSRHPTTLLLQHQLPSRRPDCHHLRSPRSIPRCHPLHVQVPTLCL